MKSLQVGRRGLLSILLVGAAMSCGCQLIRSVINFGVSILPLLLLISIEDDSGVEQIVSLPLDEGGTSAASLPLSHVRRDYRVEIHDAVRSPSGGTATIIVRYLGEAGEPVLWERVVDVPLNSVVETNVFASLTLRYRVVEPPDQRGQVRRF